MAVVEEVLVMDTGVDPSGVDAGVGSKMKKGEGNQVPQEEERVFDGEGYCNTVWGFLLRW